MNPTEQKIVETKKELKEWLENPVHQKNLTIHGLEKINQKLLEIKVPRSILVGFESLNNWYSNNFVYDLLENEQTNFKTEATANGYQIIILYETFLPQFPNNPQSPAFEKIAFFLANCVSEKWYAETDNLIKIINKGLNTRFLEGGKDYRHAAWFIIEMVNKGLNISIDYSKYNYPKNMGVYKGSLENWNTADLILMNNIVTKLCDYHLEQAFYGNEDQEDTMEIQFDNSSQFVYTYEILTWLSIREKIGLKNPEKFTHPLMGLVLNKLPTVVTPRPVDELFEKVLAKVKVQNP